MGNKAEKEFLRSSLTEIIRSIPNKDSKSSKIWKQALGLKGYIESNVVLTYISLSNEANTDRILSELFKSRKRAFAPFSKQVKIGEIKSTSDLIPGLYGISEPTTSYTGTIEIDIAFIPGLGFTKEGFRLGRGGGWYDQLLSLENDIRIKTKIGICFEEQILRSIPFEKHDRKVEIVITDKNIYNPPHLQ